MSGEKISDSLKIQRRNAAVNMARDICLKLIERRAVAPENLNGAMSLLAAAAEALFEEINDGDGLWLVRMARDFTLKMVERNFIGTVQAAALALNENGRMLAAAAAGLDPALAPTALGAARDLSLKLLETGRLSRTALPDFFRDLASSLAGEKS